MPRIVWTVLVAGVTAVALPQAAHAQSAAYLASLATPPASVGQCSAAPAPVQLRADAPVAGFTGRQLLLAAGDTATTRTMIAYIDPRGRPRQFAEWTAHRATGRSSASAEIEATVDTAGGVRGFRLQHTLLVGGAAARHTRRPLTLAEQRSVRVLTQWLLARCPA